MAVLEASEDQDSLFSCGTILNMSPELILLYYTQIHCYCCLPSLSLDLLFLFHLSYRLNPALLSLFIICGYSPGRSCSCKSLTCDNVFVDLIHSLFLTYNQGSYYRSGRGAKVPYDLGTILPLPSPLPVRCLRLY
jgi:hypothetical protein